MVFLVVAEWSRAPIKLTNVLYVHISISLSVQAATTPTSLTNRGPTPRPEWNSDVADADPLSPVVTTMHREKTFTYEDQRDGVVSPEAVHAAQVAIDLVASLSPKHAQPRPPSTEPPPRLTRVERARLEALAAFGGLSFDDVAKTNQKMKSKRVMTMKDWESKKR